MNRTTDTIIIGAGLSGLAVAHRLRTSCYGHRFIVLERKDRTGGAIRSHHENGFIAEIGPHGFLDNCNESNALLRETGLAEECIASPLGKFVRYVLRDGKLQMIPQSPLKILKAPLIPWKDKLRVLADLWKKPLPGEPSVAKWVEHRFGPALLPYADAVFTGTYAGDINLLAMDAVMPGLRNLERAHGSLIRGALAKMSTARKQSEAPRRLQLPAMTSFPEGMGRLTQRLTDYLSEDKDLFLCCEAQTIAQQQDGQWLITTNKGEFQAKNLVIALPVNVALHLLSSFTPPQASIPEGWILAAVFGFSGEQLPPGFGYLSPESEKRFSLGTLFSSNMFPGRAPEGHILFETLVGGRRHPERLTLSDEDILQAALEDVKDVLPLNSAPVYSRVLRPESGIPQLESGYPALLAWREELTRSYPGLHVIGFGWDGIGINDMTKHADRVAHEIRQPQRGKNKEKDIKGVYF